MASEAHFFPWLRCRHRHTAEARTAVPFGLHDSVALTYGSLQREDIAWVGVEFCLLNCVLWFPSTFARAAVGSDGGSCRASISRVSGT